jgi:iron complex outermembrane receptor protein
MVAEQLERTVKPGLVAALLGSILAANASLVSAQPEATTGSADSALRRTIEEVVVTARKREESIQDVPMSVSAMTGAQLREAGFNDLGSTAQYTPNLWFESTDPSRSFVQMRGIGNRLYDATIDPAVGIFIDGIYQGRIASLNPDLLDVERIEILKGPQGTLYGRNTIGGAISVVTSDPGMEQWQGRAGLEWGEGSVDGDRLQNLSAAANGPLIESTLAAAISVARRERDGPNRSLLTGIRGGGEDSLTVKGKLLWDISEQASVVLSASQRDDDGPSIFGWANHRGDHTTPFQARSEASPPPTYTDNPREVSENAQLHLKRENRAASITGRWQGDALSLTSITGYQESFVDELSGDAIDLDVFTLPVLEDQTQISQEFRAEYEIGAFSLLGGVYYSNEVTDRIDGFVFGQDSIFPLLNGGEDVTWDIDRQIETTNYAVFGQLNWELSERLRMTLGVRASRDEKSQDVESRTNAPALDPGDAIAGLVPPLTGAVGDNVGVSVIENYTLSLEESWSSVDPLFSVAWDLLEDTMVYATWSKGFKAGTFQAYSPSEATTNEIMDPEEVINLEVGVKSTLLDQRLRINAAVFEMDYKDLQLFKIPQEAQLVVAAIQSNAAQSTIRGVEMDGTLIIGERWKLDFSYSWLDAVFEEYLYSAEEGIDYSGNKLARSPDSSYSVAVNYVWPLAIGDITTNLSYSWQDSFFWEVDNNQPERDVEEDARGVVNASIALTTERWSLRLWGTNLTDEIWRSHIVEGGLDPVSGRQNASLDYFGPTRTIGLRLGLQF